MLIVDSGCYKNQKSRDSHVYSYNQIGHRLFVSIRFFT